jgi:hypothetical protein
MSAAPLQRQAGRGCPNSLQQVGCGNASVGGLLSKGRAAVVRVDGRQAPAWPGCIVLLRQRR